MLSPRAKVIDNSPVGHVALSDRSLFLLEGDARREATYEWCSITARFRTLRYSTEYLFPYMCMAMVSIVELSTIYQQIRSESKHTAELGWSLQVTWLGTQWTVS